MSLTPQSRRAEATNDAMHEGLVSGAITFVPSMAVLYMAMKNPTFVARTNWQSRTALTIMPPLFAFAWTAEHRMASKMREIAEETKHQTATVRWAEAQQELAAQQMKNNNFSIRDKELQLLNLYRTSVQESGVRVVPDEEFGTYHQASNYVASNPVKVLAGLAIPSVAMIFYGRTGKEHLQMSMKLLHTRVFGQFTTLSLLLGVMGFKEYMDQSGKYIPQSEADARVEEMRQIREALKARLEYEREVKAAQQKELREAHETVLAARRNKKKKAATSATSDLSSSSKTPSAAATSIAD